MRKSLSKACLGLLSTILVADLLPDSGAAARAPRPSAARQSPAAESGLTRSLSELRQAMGELTASGMPGVAVELRDGGRTLFLSSGYANLDQRTPITEETRFMIASVSKAFSGATVLSLVRDGRLALDDTVGQRVPGLLPAAQGVTIRQLLDHTGGVPDFTSDPRFLTQLSADPFRVWAPRDLTLLAADRPLNFAPGSAYRYSNTDNIVLGLIVEAVTGNPYEEELRRRVLEPLGLRSTFLNNLPELPEPHALGYAYPDPAHPGEGVPEASILPFSPTAAWASGAVASTPRDAARFISGVLSGEVYGKELLDEAQRTVLGSSDPPGPGANRAGLSLFRYELGCGTLWGHTGQLSTGWRAFTAATPDGGRAVSVLVNGHNVSARTNELTLRVQELASCLILREGLGAAESCRTLCFRAPEFYRNDLGRLPAGAVIIPGVNFNSPVGTTNAATMRLALQGGDSAQQSFVARFVAAQLSLLAAPGAAPGALRSSLGCHGLEFAPERLSDGTTLGPGSTLGELFAQSRRAAHGGSAADVRTLADILGRLTGDDSLGRCGAGAVLSFSPAVQQALDEALTRTMAEYNVPGAIAGVWIPGEGSWAAARGVSDLATGEPMRLENHWRVASLTKTFTVTAILQLADGPQPRLRLDDPVSKYLDFVPNGDRITIRMLANMTAGLFNYPGDEQFVLDFLANPQRSWAPRELADAGLRNPTLFAPGEGWNYSNTNIVLLGLVVEQVTSQKIQDFYAERIFGPLGLRHTSWPTTTELPAPYARGYSNVSLDGSRVDATNWHPSFAYSAGQLISDLADLKIWAKALATGTLLSPAMQAERLIPVTFPPNTATENYRLGIGYDNGWLGHGGTFPGYNTTVFYLPEMDATIIVMTNTETRVDREGPAAAVFKALARIVTPGNVPRHPWGATD